jgi:hypothetical protein
MKTFKYVYITLMAICSFVPVQAIRPNLFFLQGLAAPSSPCGVDSALKGGGNAALWCSAAFCISGPPGAAIAGAAVVCHAAKSMHTRKQLNNQEGNDSHEYSEHPLDADIYDSSKIGMGFAISAATTIYTIRKQAAINEAILHARIVAIRNAMRK